MATVHGKHQPLQWNIGKVHRYFGKCGMVQVAALHTALRYAPRWCVTTPLGSPVVPLV